MIQWLINIFTRKSIPLLWITLNDDIKNKGSFTINVNPAIRNNKYVVDYLNQVCEYLREESGLTNEDFK